MWKYATGNSTSVCSHLGARRNGVDGGCIVTVGLIICRVPAAYRMGGVSILDKWCRSVAVESAIQEEIEVTRSLRNTTSKVKIISSCDVRMKNLERASHLAIEQSDGIERNPHFGAAVDWAAVDLARRLGSVSIFELKEWAEVLEVSVGDLTAG